MYNDNKTCARLVGLNYIEESADGFYRHKRGKGFSYRDSENNTITDREIKRRIVELYFLSCKAGERQDYSALRYISRAR